MGNAAFPPAANGSTSAPSTPRRLSGIANRLLARMSRSSSNLLDRIEQFSTAAERASRSPSPLVHRDPDLAMQRHLEALAALRNADHLRQALEASMEDEVRPAVPGVDTEVVDRVTSVIEYKCTGFPDNEVCQICRDTYSDGDTLRLLPCLHRFHIACVEKWLVLSGVCPVCKHKIATSS